jgi:serine/threonine protein kinase HipA of HipAB toxin-antitoxin module
LRNTIEGLNGYVKDTAHQALAQPARRRVRGIAACSLFTALLPMAASIRKIRAWRALTTPPPDPRPAETLAAPTRRLALDR